MGRYYKTTPWVAPDMHESVKRIFENNGEKWQIKRNAIISGKAEPGALFNNTETLIYIKSGLLGQSYKTYDPNRPYAMSLVLPGRMVNYLHYMDIDNSGDIIIALRKSEIYSMSKSEFNEIADDDTKEHLTTYCKGAITSDFDGFCCMFACEAPKRVIYLYKSLADSLCGDYSNESIITLPIKLSYVEISYVMHTTVRTIERLLPVWRAKGHIHIEKDKTIINTSLFAEIDSV